MMAQFKNCLWVIFVCGLHFVAHTSANEAGNLPVKNLWQEAGFTYGNLEPQSRYPRQGGESDIVFNSENENVFKEDPFVDANFSEKELDCFALRKFLYNDECHPLAVKGGPCAADEWLILEKDDVLRNSYLRPVCKKKRCAGKDEVWWSKTKKCELKSNILANECRKQGKQVQVDAYGDGICVCPDSSGELEGGKMCYEYYQQGPCAMNQVITYVPSTGFAVCSIDKCMNENRGRTTRDTHKVGHYGDTSVFELPEKLNRRKRASPKGTRAPPKPLSNKKEYAPFNGVGDCFKLGLSGPCTVVDKQSRYVIDAHLHLPRCSIPDNQLHVIDAPVLCRLDDKNQCRDQISIRQEDRSAYLGDLKNQFRKKSG